MYNCEVCKKTSAPCEPRQVIVIHRDVPARQERRRTRDGRMVAYTAPARKEIAKEITVCEGCKIDELVDVLQ